MNWIENENEKENEKQGKKHKNWLNQSFLDHQIKNLQWF